jgi:hypothetical protein
VSSFYDFLTYGRCGVAVANTPWSGSYEVISLTNSFQHRLFTPELQWQPRGQMAYLTHREGCTDLVAGHQPHMGAGTHLPVRANRMALRPAR